MDNLFNSLRCRVNLTWDSKEHEEIEINKPADIYRIVRDELVNADREIFLSVLLTAHNTIIGIEKVGIGGLYSCTVSARELFKSAILANASSIVLCHNHPSGDLTPSDQDRKITEKLKEAGKLLGITILDHIIITNKGYTSLDDNQSKSILSRRKR
ncbi:MAG: JAB domain-containing protein [Proteobacteria bacterium]|nr:JAB domain-containing protein [Pseudomonadota bacterium]